MQTIWKGAISFGLVHVPIKMHAATENKDISFRTLHKSCGMPIKNEKKCQHCDKAISSDEIVKGYEYEPGKFVIIKDEELEAIAPTSAKLIQILDFVDLTEIDPFTFKKHISYLQT
ncbi:hypothetical protein ASF12_22220 [Paenibacillus sp. Leaf72]|nr:hypothetical protein ASF12_22220 [Paenibacillus sp. Leaf72]